MLVGLVPPTSGDALVFGKNINTDMVSYVLDPILSSLLVLYGVLYSSIFPSNINLF